MPATPVVDVRGLERSFGDVNALDGVTLSVDAGEIVGLLGHNGAGKTTIVRTLLGILQPHGGSVRVHELDPFVDGASVRRQTGLVSAIPVVDDRLTARQNLRFVAGAWGLDKAQAERTAMEMLERLELADRIDDRVGTFSTGMRQRLALVRALLPDPVLLVLDEPTAALDPVVSRDVRTMVSEFGRRPGRAVLLCSHNLTEAQQLCDRVVVLREGHAIAQGTPAGLGAQLGLGRLRIEVDPSDHACAAKVLAQCGAAVEGAVDGVFHASGLSSSVVPQLVAALVGAGIGVRAVVPEEPSLEDVYFALHDSGARP